MKDVMIDLETLGTRHDAMIIQVGACYFDRMTGEIGREFKATIEPGEHEDKFSIDYDTVKWWFVRTDAARKSVIDSPVPLFNALNELAVFLEGWDIKIWSHATFDMPILMNSFDKLKIKFPVPYKNARDIRTLMDLSGPSPLMERAGIHHDALDDAKFQVKYCVAAIEMLHTDCVAAVKNLSGGRS